MVPHEDLPIPAGAEQTMRMPIANERYWTVDDVWALPDDPHHRYEAVDGELLVSPSPRVMHQRVAGELFVALHAYCLGAGTCDVLMAPSDVVVEERNLVQPDVYLIRKLSPADMVVGPRELPLPLLAIEVLSPKTARADRVVKRRLFQRNGVEMWVVDADARLIERWTPGATRPEVCTDVIGWRAPGTVLDLSLDIAALLRRARGEEG